MPNLESDHYRFALQQIVNCLGPDTVSGCPDCNDSCQGLLVEADEALRIAKQALGET